MFKKLILSLCIFLAFCPVVYAEQEVSEVQDVIQPEVVESAESIDIKEESVFNADKVQIPSKEISVDMYFDEISERLSKKINLKKPEEFVSIMACSPRAMYENVSDYTAFVCEYNLTDAQLEVINRVLDKGTTIQSLIQVYKFWLTTDYDFTMVEEICALEDSYFSEYWYESAFNAITGNIHGVLSAEDINYYRNLGITTDEILAANVLCRKEGQNIFDILDGVVNGVDIETRALEIYEIDSLPGEESLFKSVTDVAESTVRTFSASAIYTDELNVMLSKEEVSALNDIAVSEKVATELKRLNLSDTAKSYADDYYTLNSIPLPISIKRALLNKGYTPEEIQQVAFSHETNLNKAARNAREAVKNEK